MANEDHNETPGAVEDDPPTARPVGHEAGDGVGDVRGVHGIRAVRAAIVHLVAGDAQRPHDRILERDAAVIGGGDRRALGHHGPSARQVGEGGLEAVGPEYHPCGGLPAAVDRQVPQQVGRSRRSLVNAQRWTDSSVDDNVGI